MKKILVLILALAVLLSCACNKNASETTDDGCFYLYSETGSDLNTEVFAGKYNSPEEVDSVLGRY